ncbi:cysteine desulfuration protein SufE [Oceanospirillum multiglobuliferum]|uniref:Fe-S cluster assembly protein SufE n=1 Tax=Oceanospirillum multiglobuliferum TaxID=64969 RepID=A0A1T4PEX7_9GAMM|nr:SufE family protein [Oceanospirillum multiglobuliferum]OPX55579.1 Fe-S cluster assembly protein SufE [Oceanospirillum multiglobuliferum]SJZ90110.1 cysteine desulfuration protein SufE [Oceanospirillum multiglobuliferum]
MSDIHSAQQTLVDEFDFFDDWMDKYQYIIDLGKQLPSFPDEWKTDANKITGCQSQVWIHHELNDGKIKLFAISDAAIVSGLIALLLKVYDNRTPQEILTTEPVFLTQLGLDKHLSPTRSNGLHSMLQRIAELAKHYSI